MVNEQVVNSLVVVMAVLVGKLDVLRVNLVQDGLVPVNNVTHLLLARHKVHIALDKTILDKCPILGVLRVHNTSSVHNYLLS